MACAALAVGCLSADGSSAAAPDRSQAAADEQVGTLGMTLVLPGGQSLNTVAWSISGPNGSGIIVQQGTVNVPNSLTISFTVGGLPPGSNYVIALSGISTDGLVSCAGSAQFNVTARATTNVTDLLQCNAPLSEAGSLAVAGQFYDCASWSAVTVTPSEQAVGMPLALLAKAAGDNPGAITYAWSAPSGTFSSPSSATTNYTCAAPGVVTVTLVVGDGAIPDGGSCSASLTTTTAQVLCDPSGSPDAAAEGGDGSTGADASGQ